MWEVWDGDEFYCYVYTKWEADEYREVGFRVIKVGN